MSIVEIKIGVFIIGAITMCIKEKKVKNNLKKKECLTNDAIKRAKN